LDWPSAIAFGLAALIALHGFQQARFALEQFGGTDRGFDGTAPLAPRKDIPDGARHGTVTIGGDPAAREAAFTQLAAWLDNPHP
ncbi:dienelactone hydrolase family protein, partial [Ralstonia pseudosolanacearum]